MLFPARRVDQGADAASRGGAGFGGGWKRDSSQEISFVPGDDYGGFPSRVPARAGGAGKIVTGAAACWGAPGGLLLHDWPEARLLKCRCHTRFAFGDHRETNTLVVGSEGPI